MHGHRHFHPRAPDPYASPNPVPLDHLRLPDPAPAPQDAPLLKRDSTSSSSSSSETCGPNDTTGRCERAASSMNTTVLPIVLGAVIPLSVAIIVLLWLHRRHVKRVRNEDANYKHKSLDFGLDMVPPSGKKKGRKGGMEMSTADAEKSVRRNDRGLSLDITMNNPYLLPPGLHSSRESLHSLSRSIQSNDDKYRTASPFSPTENRSMRSFRGNFRGGADDSSSFTGMSSRRAPHGGDEMNLNLLQNAQRMSRASPPPPERDSLSEHDVHAVHAVGTNTNQMVPPRSTSPVPDTLSHRSAVRSPGPMLSPHDSMLPADHKGGNELRKSNDYLGAFIQRGTTPETGDRSQSPPVQGLSPYDGSNETDAPALTPPSLVVGCPDDNTSKSGSSSQTPQMPRISLPSDDDQSDYGDEQRKSNINLPQVNVEPAETNPPSPNRKSRLSTVYGLPDDQGYVFDSRRLTVGIRPLPPEDPSDNPEQRANRIRSFYKEYFDENKPVQEEYYEDYGPEDYPDGMVYDPALDPYGGDMGFYPPEPPPFAHPVGRRAMTPPPRMPPNFHPPRYEGASSAFGYVPGPRAFSSMSGGDPGPRAYSSISNRAPMPRKPMPPPAPLHVLPTPHKLKDDTFLPIDFAPPPTSKDRRAGRPETPQGGLRPYTPNLPAHIPLASSYDDLAAMPSPHALRKSGTFTALDFAPPPRFRNAETASDAGSIRSNRTGVSAAHSYNIRTGAYRVSRLPAETVGTKADITSNLRPKWDLST
ncbi:hypothetical protein AJ79_09874 [Helicocarpus griseus UAMH5409]|uniref:Uncharacterized protein n=1 Tax=Helicocarpus griseus UAMH5409 TaxID=1447875 RepID=A0A2B7WGQ8_9EURO|nr:hypothetical protein AJ79_09874 [Helicocarpus griseus UAMH5409]